MKMTVRPGCVSFLPRVQVLSALAVILLCLAPPPEAFAEFVWSGNSTNANWAYAYNWSGTGPRDNFNSTFLFGGIANLNNVNNLANGTALGIAFAGNAGPFVMGGNSLILAGDISNNSTNTQTLNFNMNLGSVSRNVTTTAGDVTLGGVLSGAGGITKSNTSNALFLTGNNTFTGPVSILKGTLYASSLNKVAGGRAGSNLGAPFTVADGTISFGTGMQFGRLVYTGAGETTDRQLKFSGTGGIVLDQSGTGLLKFTGNTLTASSTFSYLLQFQGSTTGRGEFAGIIANASGGGIVSVTKTGNGTWTLSGPNTYSGNTTVAGGTLLIAGNQPAATGSVTVTEDGALGGNGTIGGNVYFQSGAGLALGTGTLKIASGKKATFEDLRVEDIAGIGTAAAGTYALIQGTVDSTNIFDRNGIPVDIGASPNAAYFTKNGSGLQVVVQSRTYTHTTLPSPKYERLPLGAIMPKGWILNQLGTDISNGIAGHFLEFRPFCGITTWTQKNGNSGQGEVSGNWMDGFIRMAYYTGNQTAKDTVNAFVTSVLGASDNGYIGNLPLARRYLRLDRDLFSDSRISMALLAHYELSGNTADLVAVKAMMDLNMRNYTPDNRPFNHKPLEDTTTINGHSLMYADVCEWLYRITGERRYLSYAEFLYKDFSASSVNDCSPQDIKISALLQPALVFAGHGAHVAEHLRVPLFLAYTDVRDPYAQITTNALAKMEACIVPSGAMMSDESISAAGQSPDPFRGYEYCATTELATTLTSAVEKTGTMKYADMLERLVFNAGQGARLQDGTKIAYLSSATLPKATETTMGLPDPNNDGGRWELSPAHQAGGSCCSANAVKLMPYYIESMWMKLAATEALAALHFGPSQVQTTVKGVPVTILEDTAYPFSDTITFRFTSVGTPVSFPLYIRVPAWAGTTTVIAPGATVANDTNARKVTKQWATGDTVTVSFVNPITTATCSNSEVSVSRGPLLYVEPVATARTLVTKQRAGSNGNITYTEMSLYQDGTDPDSLIYNTISTHFLEPTVLGGCFTAQSNLSSNGTSAYNAAYPFSGPPTVLKGNMRTSKTDPTRKETVTLFPMGSQPDYIRFSAFQLTN